MKRTDALITFFNKKMDELDAKKIPFELYLFDGSMIYDVITNIKWDDQRGSDYTKIVARRKDTELD